MKKTFISTFAALTFAVVASNNAGAASYTLKPITEEESNAFKNKPTVVFRLNKDTQEDVEKLERELNGYDVLTNLYKSQIIDIDQGASFGTLRRIASARVSTGFGATFSTLTDRNTLGFKTFNNYTTPTIVRGMISVGGEYDCNKITLRSSYPETCKDGSKFSADMDFDTHIVSVATLEEKIAELKTSLNSTDKTDEEKAAISKLIEKAEEVLNNQNAIQTEIDAAVAGIENGLKEISDSKAKAEEEKKKAEEEEKKAEEDKKKQEAKEEETADKEQTSSESKDSSEVKAPNTGFNQESSALAFVSTFGVLLLGATIYRLKK